MQSAERSAKALSVRPYAPDLGLLTMATLYSPLASIPNFRDVGVFVNDTLHSKYFFPLLQGR
jgi:hypothetical protein